MDHIPSDKEKYLILPEALRSPGQGANRYSSLSSLQQPHLLNGEFLTLYHHSMRYQANRVIPKAKSQHLLAGAWCQVELAHVRDFEGKTAEAQELLALATNQLDNCERLLEYENKNNDEYYKRLYRCRLLRTYIPHFVELGPVNWPDYPTPFQRSAYQRVQTEVLNPLLKDYAIHKERQDMHFPILKGVLGEIAVLQVLNRLQKDQEYLEWCVTPASKREDTKDDYVPTNLTTTFDLKITFADQTFIPLDVRWRDSNKNNSDTRIGQVAANDEDRSAIRAIRAMKNETAGRPLQKSDFKEIDALTHAIFETVLTTDRLGESIYPGTSIEASAAELSLWSLWHRYNASVLKSRL